MITEETTQQENKPKLAAILYTDGSCKLGSQGPTGYSGYIGWGAHGYIFELNKVPSKETIVENHYVTNKGYVRAGDFKSTINKTTAIAVEPIKYLDFYGSSSSMATNNVAEIIAFCYSLEHLTAQGVDTFIVLTDSQYLKRGISEWCSTWERNGWKREGLMIPNHELWMRTYTLYKSILAKGGSVVIEWVKGHDDIFGNVHADVLAGVAANYSINKVIKNEFTVTDVKGYWKSEVDRHPFINHKTIYFNTVKDYNTPGCYFQADGAAIDLTIGKRMPETSLSVIQLKEPDVAIETVKERQYRIAKESNAIVMLKLDRLYSKDIYSNVINHGIHCLNPSKGNMNISWFDKKPITIEQNPTRLSIRAIEAFNLLEELLGKFCDLRKTGFLQPGDAIQMNAHDITNFFYDVQEKGGKHETSLKYILKPEFVVGFTNTKVTVTEPYEGKDCVVNVPLILGLDLIPRNNLKKLENLNPKIHLITWRESKNSLRYATVIDCDDAIGIWSNFYSDRIFFQ